MRMTFTGVLLTVAFHSSHRLAPLLSGRGLFPLPLDGRLVVGDTPLHLLEQAILEHLLFQGLQGRFDLIVDDNDLRRGDDPAHGRGSPEVERRHVWATRGGGTTSTAGSRAAPDATAAPIVVKVPRDSSTTSPASFTMRQRHPFSGGVEMATTSIGSLHSRSGASRSPGRGQAGVRDN